MGLGQRLPSADTKIQDENGGHAADELVITLHNPPFCLSDIVIAESTMSAIKDFLAYSKLEAKLFNDWGLSKTHKHLRQTAINLYGPPGTGKTMAAQAIAYELHRPIIVVDYAAVESKYVGETSKNLKAIFDKACRERSVIFFDEADAMLSRRVTNMTHSTDVSVNQTRSVLLTLMNNHDGLVIFATNFIENYDPAFMRRILAHIEFPLPDFESRVRLWGKYIPQSLPCSVSLQELARLSDGFSGSDISSCVLKAAMSAARQGREKVEVEHFSASINEIRKSRLANSSSTSLFGGEVEKRIVSENFVISQIGQDAVEGIKK